MALVIPFLSLLLGSVFLYRKTSDLRLSIILSSITHGLFVLLASEFLGLIRCFSPPAIIAAWTVPPIALIFAQRGRLWDNTQTFLRHLRSSLGRASRSGPASLIGLALLSVILLVVALAGTPNNHDSMTYHLPRIAIWLQQSSLNHFPADDFRMLYNPPLAELLQAHAWVLASGYQPAMNLVQLAAYVLLAAEASMIARAAGAGSRIQMIVALATAALPSAVLQAPTTQNDLVMGAFLFAGMVCLINLSRDRSGLNWFYGLLGLSLALATKGTALMFIPFILIIPVAYALKFKKLLWLPLLIVILLPSTGWLVRNQSCFGHPLGYHDRPSMERNVNFYRNEVLGPATCLSAAARNMSLFLATPLPELNGITEGVVRRFCKALGTDPDDPGSTWYYQTYHLPLTGPHEDSPPVFWHFVLALALFAGRISLDIRQRSFSLASRLSLCCIAGMAATAAYVKWMPWNVRYMSLWLIPLLAASENQGWLTKQRVGIVLCTGLTLAALPFACFSMRRSLASFSMTVNSRRLEFVSVFDKDVAFKYVQDRQKAQELRELTTFVAGLDPSTITLARGGVDPAIFPFMSLAAVSLNHRAAFAFSTNDDLAVGRDTIVSLGSSDETSGSAGLLRVFRNEAGTVWKRHRVD